MRARTAAAAGVLVALAGGAVPATTGDAVAPGRGACVEAGEAIVGRSPGRVSAARRRASPPSPDAPEHDAEQGAVLPPLLPLAQHAVTELAILANADWAPPEERARVREELLARGDAAIRELTEAFLQGQEPSSSAARRALVEIGARTVPHALELLRDGDPDTRESVLWLLESITTSPGGLGRHRDAVLAAAATAADDADPDVVDVAEDLLAEIPGALEVVARRLAGGTEAQRLSALSILGWMSVGEDAPQVRDVLEAAARDARNSQAVRDAAAYQRAWFDDVDGPLDTLPDPAGLPAVRLWALLFAHDADEPRDDVLAALRARRDEAMTIFVGAALHGRDLEAVAWALDGVAAADPDSVAALLGIAAAAASPTARWNAIDRIAHRSAHGGHGDELPAVRDALFAALADPAPDVRDAACAALAQLASARTDVVADLARLLDDPSRAPAAADTLRRIGAGAASATGPLARVVDARSASPELRTAALGALDAIDVPVATSIARTQLGSSVPDLRASAAQCVLRLRGGEPTDELHAVALACIADLDPRVQRLGAEFLREHGTGSRETCAAVAAALRETTADADVRRDLATFLRRRADGASPEACDAILACLGDPDPEVRRTATEARDVLAACADRAVPILTRMLSERDEEVVAHAAEALGHLGAAARPAVPAMLAALIDRTGRPRRSVALGLGWLRDDGRGALPRLVACVRRGDDDGPAGGDLTQALDLLGWTPSASDVPLLLQQMQRGPGDLAWSAVQLLDRAGLRASAATGPLVDAARGAERGWRARLVEAVGHVSRGEPEVLAFLAEELRSGDSYYGCADAWNVPAAAAKALGTIGPRARPTVPALAEALSFRESVVRREAAAAIEAITGEAPALPSLPADWDD